MEKGQIIHTYLVSITLLGDKHGNLIPAKALKKPPLKRWKKLVVISSIIAFKLKLVAITFGVFRSLLLFFFFLIVLSSLFFFKCCAMILSF